MAGTSPAMVREEVFHVKQFAFRLSERKSAMFENHRSFNILSETKRGMFHVKHSSAFCPAFPIADSTRVCNIECMSSDRLLPVGKLALAGLFAMCFSLGTALDTLASVPPACSALANRKMASGT